MKINPILIKEMKVRARSVHIPIFVMVYNGIFALIGIFMLMSSMDMLKMRGQLDYGQMNDMFLSVGIIQCAMVILVTLSVSASSFSAEKERGTLDLLLMTPVSTMELVNGKLLSCVLTVFLLATSSLPIMLLGTIYGGTDLSDVLFLMLVLVILAFAVSVRGILWSIIFDKTSVAMIFALLTEIVFFTGPFVLLEFVNTFLYNGYQYGMMEVPGTVISLLFQFLNPLLLIGGFCEQVAGNQWLTDFFVYDYGIMEGSGLYQWLEQYFVIGCAVAQMTFTLILHLINIKILKKGRNIL